MASNLTEDGDVGFQIAPMVDVVFVLLLFFMAAAGSQVASKELNSKLPSPGVAKATEISPIIIDIFPDGKVQMNNKVYDSPTSRELPELKAWLIDTIAKFGNDNPVILRPSPQTRQERVIDVLNAAAGAGVKNLTFS